MPCRDKQDRFYIYPLALLLHIWTLCTPLFGGYRDSPQCVPADPEQFDEDPDPGFYINAG